MHVTFKIGFYASTLVASLASGQGSYPPNPISSNDLVAHPDSAEPWLRFKPLAPQLSDYWRNAFPQNGNYASIPLPPLPIAQSIYPAWGDNVGDHTGSGLSTDPLFWQGVYKPSIERWELYTTPTDSYAQSLPANWHNYFQSAIVAGAATYPPFWPTSGYAANNFTDWVDLYAPYLSRAFFDDYSGFETSNASTDATLGFGRFGFPRVGAPQHVDLPPTYPPRSLDAWSSTSPLVPASGGRSTGVYVSRLTVADRLDMVTGEPLLQETDLELPFGSAVFRRIRTYSERADHGVKADNHKYFGTDFESWTRGWHGAGWMSNDMPLFYFDASQAGTITTGREDQIGPVCYFVPDAHHSIPFVQQDRSTQGANVPPDYIAPDWFDAMLLYDKSACEWGDTDPSPDIVKPGWITPPKEMKVYLHDRSVIYTIKIYYEDVDPVQHKRPAVDNNGKYSASINYGVPYYGLVTSIQDKSGNTVKITYADPDKHKPYWDPRSLAREEAALQNSIPVRQKGWYKGMIDHVKLYPAGSSEARWSIFYTYRAFFSERNKSELFFRSYNSNNVAEFVDYFDHLSHPPALHSLLVYERDVAPSEVASSRELILPCDSTTFGPAEHVVPNTTPPAFVELLVDRHSGESDNNGIPYIYRVFAKPLVGSQNNQLDYQDIQIGPTGEGSSLTVLPSDWAHQLRFSYADPLFYGEYDLSGNLNDGVFSPNQDYTLRSCGPVKISNSYWVWQPVRAAYLLKSAVLSRAELDTSAMQDLPPKFWLYRYQDVEGPGGDVPHPYPGSANFRYWSHSTVAQSIPRRLSHRYGPDTVARIYRNRPTDSQPCDFNTFVNALVGIDEDRYVEGSLCAASTNPGGPTGPFIDPGGQFGYGGGGTDAGPYTRPDGLGGRSNPSSTHALPDEHSNNLPIGLLADTMYYRWSEPYRLDPRLLSSAPAGSSGDPELIARPASWALYDGRRDDSSSASGFNIDLREKFVGGSVSIPCESLLNLTITQANQQTTGFLPGGAGLFSTVGEGGTTRWYRIYRFISAPTDPTAWRGSLYSDGGRSAHVPVGPEVIWDMASYSGWQYGDTPSSVPTNAYATHALYYYPFNFVSAEWGGEIIDAEAVNIPPSEPMWWTVVDEYDSIEEALSVNSSMAYPEAEPHNYIYNEYEFQTPWSSRRVVGMNSAGAVLSDRTWTNDDGTASTDNPPAVLEAWAYDEYLRPELKFSRGWGAAAAASNTDELVTGLVEVYEYAEPFDVNMGSPGHGAPDIVFTLAPRTPLSVAIRKGCTPGSDLRISSIEYYDEPGGGGTEPKEWRAKLPKFETFYDLLGNEVGVIEHSYGHWDPADLPDPDTGDGVAPESTQPPMRWRVRAGPAHQRSPGGPLVRAVDGQWYNNKGQLVWSVSGAMEDPIPNAQGHVSLSAGDEVFLSYYQYDKDGRQTLAVEDISLGSGGQGFTETHLVYPGHRTDADFAADPTSTVKPFWQTQSAVPEGVLFVGDDVPADDVTASELAAMLGRIASDQAQLIGTGMFRQAAAAPLNLVTFRAYNNFGEFKVVHPNGLRDIVHYKVRSAYLRELRAMGIELNEGEWRFAGQGLYNSEFSGHAFTDGIQAAIAGLEANAWSGSPYDLESGVFQDYRLEVIAEIEPRYDTAGRLTGLTVADSSEPADPIKSAVSYNGWGRPLLEINPDRLIKRYRYDGLGRLHKTFIGSRDRHYRWRTATEQDEDDDMVLTEKLFYGTTPTDSFLPVTKWTYRERSQSQYAIGDWFEPSDDQFGGTPAFAAGASAAGRSSPGRVERYGYDWRMRKVITRYEDFETSNPGVYREERVFLDNLDRVRFIAVYASQATGAAPSPDIAPGSDLPAAAAFLGTGAGDNLLSLEETVYNGAGQVVERRRYDPSGTGGYLVTHSYTDHADRAVWSSSSSGRVTKNTYDAKGRLTWTSEYAGSGVNAIEMTRSVNEYGPDGNIKASRFFERTGQTGGIDISSAPHRLSVTYTWYDTAGRVVATADMGSATYSGTAYDRTIPARTDDSPEITATIDEYRVTGESLRPRRILVGVNYPDSYFDNTTGKPIARISCMWYDRLGKQNALLSTLSASKDVSSGEKSVDFTIDRTEYNRYGQKVLEHSYHYTGDGQSFTETDFELLAGMEYTYEAQMVLEGQSTPSTVTTTQVRTITPLVPDDQVMVVAWEDQDSDWTVNQTTGKIDYTVSGKGAFVTNWLDTTARRTTVLEYGAPVIQPNFNLPSYVLHPTGPVQFPVGSIDWAYLGISNRPDLIKAVHLPDPMTGVTGNGLGYSMFFFYHADGLPAIRVDSRGIGIRYVYDSEGNLLRLSSDDANMPLVADLGMTDDQLPGNTIEYTYDALNRLLSVTTGRDYATGNDFRLDTRSVLTYDSLGNMLSEQQLRYERIAIIPADPADPIEYEDVVFAGGTVGYAWDTKLRQSSADPVNHTNNVNRLLSITYPSRVGTHDNASHSPRVVTLGYGAAGGVSDLLDRVESLTSTGGPFEKELGHVATYRYNGLSRLAGVDLGDVPGATSSPTYVQTDDRSFDLFGRVAEREVKSYDTGTGTHLTAMRSVFGYDLAGQRVFERLKQKDLNTATSRDNTHSAFYEYDALGRLVSERYGRLKTNGFEGIDHANSPAPRVQSYGLDALNRRVGDGGNPGLSIWQDLNKNGVVDTNEITLSHDHVVDARGALTGIDDGSAVAAVGHDVAGAITQYDGRNIYHDWLGRPVLVTSTSNGAPVVAYAYDGFGRLAKRTAPWPNNASLQRIESYFYDGVRRIQEVFTDPVAAIPPWPQLPGGGDPGANPQTVRTEAEYIWSAVGAQPFDTCHVQIDWWDREAWFVQDHATGTVRAYTDPNGEIVEQYGFDAFGNLIRRDEFTLVKSGSQGYYRTFRQRLGHQGLFAERADNHTNARVLDAGVELWYQSRSRWYLAELGRFMVPDPNATGIPVVSSLAMLGMTPIGPPSGSFEWGSHYSSGWDIFSAYGANPIAAQDPTGLFTFAGLFGAIKTNGILRAGAGGAIAGAVFGGASGGIMAGIQGDPILPGIFQGASIGAVAGGLGGMGGAGIVASGFGGSAGITIGLMGAGGIDGGMAAFLDTFMETGSPTAALKAAAAGAAFGSLTGGIVDVSAARLFGRLRASYGREVQSGLRQGDSFMGVMSTMSGKTILERVATRVSANGMHAMLANRMGTDVIDSLKIGFSLRNQGDYFELLVTSRGVNGPDTPNLSSSARGILKSTLERALDIPIR